MSEKTGPELELDKIVEEEEGDLEKEDNNVTNVESSVAISEPKEQNVVEENPLLSCRDEEDVEVNIIGNSGLKSLEDNCVDLTVTESSSSSSFGHSSSDSALSDSDDVESRQRREGWREPLLLRRKKVTDHWRKFIFPIMCRSKWIGLQVQKLNSQARKYVKEIAAIDQQKQLDILQFAGDDFAVKSVPRSEGIQRNKIMRRKKRKRAEECDPSSYMSNHCFFSYYENKNRDHDRPVEDFRDGVVGNADNVGEIKLNDMWSSVDHDKDNDKSFIDIIENVEALLSQVENLKTRIDTVKNENPGKFCSTPHSNIIGPSNGFNRSVHNSSSFAGKEIPVPGSVVNTTSQASQHKSELHTEDQLLTDNTLSTREGKIPAIESANRTQFEVKGESLEEKPNESVEEKKSISPAQVSDSDMVTENGVPPNVHSIKPCSASRNTRRVRRKFGP